MTVRFGEVFGQGSKECGLRGEVMRPDKREAKPGRSGKGHRDEGEAALCMDASFLGNMQCNAHDDMMNATNK